MIDCLQRYILISRRITFWSFHSKFVKIQFNEAFKILKEGSEASNPKIIQTEYDTMQ